MVVDNFLGIDAVVITDVVGHTMSDEVVDFLQLLFLFVCDLFVERC